MDQNSTSQRSPLLVPLLLGVVGIVLAVFGMFQVSRGDITLAPILLTIAYLVVFPIALTRLR
jgi:hypothetical protein